MAPGRSSPYQASHLCPLHRQAILYHCTIRDALVNFFKFLFLPFLLAARKFGVKASAQSFPSSSRFLRFPCSLLHYSELNPHMSFEEFYCTFAFNIFGSRQGISGK